MSDITTFTFPRLADFKTQTTWKTEKNNAEISEMSSSCNSCWIMVMGCPGIVSAHFALQLSEQTLID